MVLTNRACPSCLECKHMRTFDDRTFICMHCGIEYLLEKNEMIEMKRYELKQFTKEKKKWKKKPYRTNKTIS